MFFESGPLPRAPQAAPPPVPARPPMNIQPLNVHTKVHAPGGGGPAPPAGAARARGGGGGGPGGGGGAGHFRKTFPFSYSLLYFGHIRGTYETRILFFAPGVLGLPGVAGADFGPRPAPACCGGGKKTLRIPRSSGPRGNALGGALECAARIPISLGNALGAPWNAFAMILSSLRCVPMQGAGGGGGWGMNLRMNIQGLNVHGGSRRDGWGRGLRGAGERATFEKHFHFPTLYSISGI